VERRGEGEEYLDKKALSSSASRDYLGRSSRKGGVAPPLLAETTTIATDQPDSI
jgi:hypothetical protein